MGCTKEKRKQMTQHTHREYIKNKLWGCNKKPALQPIDCSSPPYGRGPPWKLGRTQGLVPAP